MKLILVKGCPSGEEEEVATAGWERRGSDRCDYDHFFATEDLCWRVDVGQGCLSGEEEEGDGGGGCLSEEENVERIRRVVDGKLSSRASVADRRRRAPDIPCGLTCLFS